MSARISNSPQLDSGSFELVRNSMLQSDDLPLAEVVEANQWQSVFDEHEIDFGSDEDAVYTPAITLWALISQAFFKGEMRSCKAAVGRVAALWATLGKRVCDTNTGAYCRARAKISWEAVRDICCEVAESAESIWSRNQTPIYLIQSISIVVPGWPRKLSCNDSTNSSEIGCSIKSYTLNSLSFCNRMSLNLLPFTEQVNPACPLERNRICSFPAPLEFTLRPLRWMPPRPSIKSKSRNPWEPAILVSLP